MLKKNIKLRDIICALVGICTVLLTLKAICTYPLVSLKYKNAIVLDEPRVLAENEGKWMLVRGVIQMTEPVYDEETGLTVNAPAAVLCTHTYQRGSNDYWGWSEERGDTQIGKAKIGEFEIEPELLRRLVCDRIYESYNEDEISSYYTLRNAGDLCFSPDEIVIPEGGESASEKSENAGKKIYSYDIFRKRGAVTLIGMQKNGKLTFAAEGDDGVVQSLNYTLKQLRDYNMKTFFACFAFLIIGLGLAAFAVYDVVKRKKHSEKQ